MKIETLEWVQFFPRPCQEIYSFFSNVDNLNRLLPSFARLKFLFPGPPPARLVPGQLFDYQLCLHGLEVNWRTRIEEVEEGRRFTDVQVRGPYRLFRHIHDYYPVEGGTVMADRVEYAVPGGPLATIVNRLYVREALIEIFTHRQRTSAAILGIAQQVGGHS